MRESNASARLASGRRSWWPWLPASILVLHVQTAPAAGQITRDALLQFTAGGHVLGFQAEGLAVASGSHVLRIDFVEGSATPASTAPRGNDSRAISLETVTYTGLWPGVDLEYAASDAGIVESTWRVHAGSDPGQIRLRYHAPVAVQGDGSLRITYRTGWMRESPPVAWQEIGGSNVPVPVRFTTLADTSGKPVVGFALGEYNPEFPVVIDPTLEWNTFLGSDNYDYGQAIAVDGSGNVLVTGYSYASWGTPLRAYTGQGDAFVAKLGPDGALQWNTFLGSTVGDAGYDIAVDDSGNVLVTGVSNSSWSGVIAPKRAHSSGPDAFAAKLDADGVLQWYTFLGGTGSDTGWDLAIDVAGNALITGQSSASWQGASSPVRAFTLVPSNLPDAFAAKVDADGVLQWNTFLGGNGNDIGYGVAVDGAGNVMVAGWSNASWQGGSPPTRAYTSDYDAFVARLDASGAMQWNTFLGGTGTDFARGISLDGNGNLLLTGTSNATWQGASAPVRAHVSSEDAFVAKVSTSGALQWNTFLGGSGFDYGFGIALSSTGDVLVVGHSTESWQGSAVPERAYTANWDAFVADLGANGELRMNTFLGDAGIDHGTGIAVDGDNVLVTGDSEASWQGDSAPVRAFSENMGTNDVYVARLQLQPQPQPNDAECTYYPLPLPDGGAVMLCL